MLRLLLSGILSVSVFAQTEIPSHNCKKPDEIHKFSDQTEYDNYMGKADEYKQCISDFVETQKKLFENNKIQANKYKEAAQKAIEEYNSFLDSVKKNKEN